VERVRQRQSRLWLRGNSTSLFGVRCNWPKESAV
jgi:hypothetical protein